MSLGDTIFAVSTHSYRAAIHVTRISGWGLLQKLGPLFSSHMNKELEKKTNLPTTRYGKVYNTFGSIIDDVVMTFFPTPYSYTGEDVFEISTHGNPIILSQLHSRLRDLGARDAQPGEFTQRAFLNGKLDLTQAEAVNLLIHSETEGGVELARSVNEGQLTSETQKMREELIKILAYLEAHIDFGSDDIGAFESKSLLPQLDEATKNLETLSQSYQVGQKITNGLKVGLIGKPNSGKSSLYNSLLKSNRAIVTDIPGTTRDVLSEKLVIDKRDFILLDTAGIRDTLDEVEKIGVSRSKEAMEEADIVSFLIDLSDFNGNDVASFVKKELDDLKSLKIVNAHDLLVFSKSDIVDEKIAKSAQSATNFTSVFVNQKDVSKLTAALCHSYDAIFSTTRSKQNAILISQRQKDKVDLAVGFLNEARVLIVENDFPEKTASVINAAKSSLEEVIGEISVDDVMGSVFTQFCIGK